jgi:renal tumor antigen
VNNLREIQALHRLSPHPNIIRLIEVLYDQPTGRLALVFELMDMNVYELIRGRRHYVAEDRVVAYMYQLMKSMDHMHRNGIFHRDIKPENILLMDDVLKLADFGSCRGIYSKQPYTEYISTRWYRAPECLLTDGYYNYKMDMWGIGCVFFEIVSLYPLFPGTNELDQITKIHNIIGTPPPALLAKMKQRSAHMDFNFPPREGTGVAPLIPHATPECVDLVCSLLQYDPDARLSARQALRHPYFRELREQDKRQQALLQAANDAVGSTPPGDVRATPASGLNLGNANGFASPGGGDGSGDHSRGSGGPDGKGAPKGPGGVGSPSISRCAAPWHGAPAQQSVACAHTRVRVVSRCACR